MVSHLNKQSTNINNISFDIQMVSTLELSLPIELANALIQVNINKDYVMVNRCVVHGSC